VSPIRSPSPGTRIGDKFNSPGTGSLDWVADQADRKADTAHDTNVSCKSVRSLSSKDFKATVIWWHLRSRPFFIYYVNETKFSIKMYRKCIKIARRIRRDRWAMSVRVHRGPASDHHDDEGRDLRAQESSEFSTNVPMTSYRTTVLLINCIPLT
jgi:hypothetical protein